MNATTEKNKFIGPIENKGHQYPEFIIYINTYARTYYGGCGYMYNVHCTLYTHIVAGVVTCTMHSVHSYYGRCGYMYNAQCTLILWWVWLHVHCTLYSYCVATYRCAMY